MSSRLKILACSQVERIKNVILDNVQVQVLDTVTKNNYNIFCHLISEPDESNYYEINVCEVPDTDDDREKVIDTCRMDSSCGIFMGESFACDVIDEELGDEIITLITERIRQCQIQKKK